MSSLPKSEPESRWGGPATILALVLVGAAVVRLVGIRYGLPYGGLLNPDEQNIVPRAWALSHGEGPDPHPFFDYPSLLLYVLAPFQWWQDAPSYYAARLVAVAIGVAGVAAAWWLGERSYGVVAGGVGAVATAIAGVHVAYSRMAVTDVLLTTLVTVALALVVTGRLELAGIVAGLAFSTKWPGVLVLAPIVAVAWGNWRRVGIAAALALGAFVATSPFAILHVGEAASDWWTVSSRAREGWLGFENDSFSAVAFTAELWDALGPALVVGALGLVVALVLRAPADRALASFALVYFATLLPLDSHFDRYVLPLVPVLGVLAGRFRDFAPVTLLLLIVPFTWTVRDTEELTKTDTRERGVARVEAAASGAPVVLDPGLPVPRLDVLRLELPARWAEPDPNRDLTRIRALDIGPEFVWVNGSVVDRVRAARDEYPRENAFYDALEREGRRVFRLEPNGELAGPWTALFQLPSRP